MAKQFVSNKDETVRMFKSDFIEAFSRTHWTVPIILYIPFVLYLLYISISRYSLSAVDMILLILGGLFAWTFFEYMLHRFVFHYEPKSELGKKLHWTLHGVHHDYPMDSGRLVMPPSISIPLAAFFYFFYRFLFGYYYASFLAGFVAGYIAYDTIHYAVHHFAFKNKFWLNMKAHHMKHHYTNPDFGYGVSTSLWDYVFGTTKPKKESAN